MKARHLRRVVVGGPVGAHEARQVHERGRDVGVQVVGRAHVQLHARQRQPGRQRVLPAAREPAPRRTSCFMVKTLVCEVVRK